VSKPYNEDTIRKFCASILEDEFDDHAQNERVTEGDVSGASVLRTLLSLPKTYLSSGHAAMPILNVGAGSTSISRYFGGNQESFDLEPCPNRASRNSNRNVIEGWSENINTDLVFGMIVCWGTLCFVRSLPETLIQFNERLAYKGSLIVDIVSRTTMPLAQTADPDSFTRYVEMYGFSLRARIPFCHTSAHARVGFEFVKDREYDPRYLRMPQCEGRIRNFLMERDWFLR